MSLVDGKGFRVKGLGLGVGVELSSFFELRFAV